MTNEISQTVSCPHCQSSVRVTLPKKTVFTTIDCPVCRRTFSVINNKGRLETDGNKL